MSDKKKTPAQTKSKQQKLRGLQVCSMLEQTSAGLFRGVLTSAKTEESTDLQVSNGLWPAVFHRTRIPKKKETKQKIK